MFVILVWWSNQAQGAVVQNQKYVTRPEGYFRGCMCCPDKNVSDTSLFSSYSASLVRDACLTSGQMVTVIPEDFQTVT